MIKQFCDRCGDQLDVHGNAVGDRLTARDGRFQVQVLVAVDNTWNSGQLCAGCVSAVLLAEYPLRDLAVAEPTDLDPCYGNPVEKCTNPGHVKRGHEELFAAEADYWQKRHAALSERVRSSIEALGGTAYIGDYDNAERPEPPVATTFTNPSTGVTAWQRLDDGWHCSNEACWNCPAHWAEVVELGHIDALTRHLPGGDEA